MRASAVLSSWGLACAVVLAACGSSRRGNGFAGTVGDTGGDGGGPSSSGGLGGSSGAGGSGGGGGGGGGSLSSDGGSAPAPAEAGTPLGDPVTCADAAKAHSYIGCDYWPTVTANNVWSIFDFAVVVANAGTTTANVTVTGPNDTNQTGTVAPGSLTTMYLPWVPDLKGPDLDNCGAAAPISNSVLSQHGAYHLVSSVPVTVYQFNALEYAGQGGPPGKDWSSCPGNTGCQDSFPPQPIGCYSFTNDASLLLPSTAMTGNYRVTGHGGWGGQPGIPAYVTITATQNDTNLSFHVSSTGQVIAGGSGSGIGATGANGTVSLTMNAGDVAELVGGSDDSSDLSGSLVQASAPVQVITGMPCVDIPDQAPACDHIEESNLPAETLGKDYVVAQPAAPNGNAVGHEVRIYGNFDGTHLTYVPSAPPNCPTTINAGQVVDCGAPLGSVCTDPTGAPGASCGAGNIVTQDFEVKGDQPFAVASFSMGASLVDGNDMPPNQAGDPDQTMAVTTAQFRTKYVFLAPTDYTNNYVVIVAPMGAMVTLDGQAVTASPTPVGSSGYGVMRVKLSTGKDGAHVLQASQPVGIQVMGYGSYTSYTYPGGLDLVRIAPPPPPPPPPM